MTLTAKDLRELADLLGVLQYNLESAIEGAISNFIADDDPWRTYKLMTLPVGRDFVMNVKEDRKHWRLAEQWRKLLIKMALIAEIGEKGRTE